MSRPLNYKTKQSEAILSYIASQGDAYVTAGQIAAHFEHTGAPVALTTVYRHLDKLADGGKIRRYMIDGVPGACYQFIDGDESSKEHFYLKCEKCGGFVHLRCSEVNTFRQHIVDEHAFQIDPVKTVLYGKCKTCS